MHQAQTDKHTDKQASAPRSPIALWIVATPIGHLGDISHRAADILAQVDEVLAEDTRHTRQLLEHFSIRQTLSSLHEHNEQRRIDSLLEAMQQGKVFALVSDAGTPLISDPGYRLVRACYAAGLRVSTAPGACAAVAALSVSGLPSNEFRFVGFLPARAATRRKQLQQLAEQPVTQIYYEAPQRLVATLQSMQQEFGSQREVCLCRELTKQFETVVRLPLAELIDFVTADRNQQRGEIVLVVDAAAEVAADRMTAAQRELYLELAQHVPPGKLAGIMARHWKLSRQHLYDMT